MLKAVREKWHQYKYRFVPWLTFNLRNRSVRSVEKSQEDKILSDQAVEDILLKFFRYLYCAEDETYQEGSQTSEERDRAHHKQQASNTWARKRENTLEEDAYIHTNNMKHMHDVLGFSIDRKQSSLLSGGTGVFVTKGTVPPKAVVAMYPGTIYQLGDPIFLPSIRNPFVFRCIDGLHVDGNDKGMSKLNFRGCSKRDRIGFYECCDVSWLTEYPTNPLAIGQYVNNQSKEFAANVAYQEFDVPADFPVELRKYLPNNFFRMKSIDMEYDTNRLLRTVVLVSLREIQEGEELFSNYFTLVQ